MKRPSLLLTLPLAATLTLGAVACGSDKDDASSGGTTTTEASATGSDATMVAFVKSVQHDLEKVGCYSGSVDGEDGPETEDAIKAFQEAEGLTADGEAGRETMTELSNAVTAGLTVCGGSSGLSTTSTTTKANSCADVTEASFASSLADSKVDNWKCATDAGGQAWVGGTATQGDEFDYNFILESSGGDSWSRYSMNPCSNPPVPESLVPFCEAS